MVLNHSNSVDIHHKGNRDYETNGGIDVFGLTLRGRTLD
jgi:hypothetical protein